MSTSIRPLPGTTIEPLYPDSDGVPIGETDYHILATGHLFFALKRWYRKQKDVHVAGNMLLYYEEGNPNAFRGPDVMVSKGVVGNHLRRSFRTWEEGVVPAVIIEVTSKKTRKEDQVEKPPLYSALGVKELVLFDPTGDYLRPRLKGFRLVGQKYVPMKPDKDGRLFSAELGLSLEVEDYLLRLIDPATGTRLPTDEELDDAASLARKAAQKAKREAKAAKRRAAELETELAQFRGLRPAGNKGK
ncbi:MAG: Uma2 family endonuclease [Pirellulales bacterium]